MSLLEPMRSLDATTNVAEVASAGTHQRLRSDRRAAQSTTAAAATPAAQIAAWVALPPTSAPVSTAYARAGRRTRPSAVRTTSQRNAASQTPTNNWLNADDIDSMTGSDQSPKALDAANAARPRPTRRREVSCRAISSSVAIVNQTAATGPIRVSATHCGAPTTSPTIPTQPKENQW